MVARPFVGCGVPSGLNTSHITRYPSFLAGSLKMATGFSKQSEDPPGACSVELPSKHHTGQSSNVPLKSLTIFVLLRKLWVGLYPSSQMYSSFVFLDIIYNCVKVVQFVLEFIHCCKKR